MKERTINLHYNRIFATKYNDSYLFIHMFSLILTLIAGVFLGRIFANNKLIRHIPKLIFPIVLVLLFIMGIAIGSNPDIINNLDTLGLEALIITSGALLGTMGGAYALGKYLFGRKEAKA